jgi:predicted nucleic acid-binding protein
MQKIIVSDTSCLILLDKLDQLDLLSALFGEITITQIVADEFGKQLPKFIKIENPQNLVYQKILESFIDIGEASALSLALEKKDCLLIMDDNKGRREAKQLGLRFTGTLGVLIIAKQKGVINSLTEILDKIKKTDFRLSDALIKYAIKRSDEPPPAPNKRS